MRLIKSSYEILSQFDGMEMLKAIEAAGRTCYKSEDKITEESAIEFVRKRIMAPGHLSVIEHEKITVRFIFDRGVSHEMVRHRIASYSQESTRYCNYTKNEHDSQISLIEIHHHFNNPDSLRVWENAMINAENAYMAMIELGESPQIARSVLPNSLKTEIVVTANLREWRLIFEQRTSSRAHPQMREVMIPLFEELRAKIPVIFEDLRVQI